jgi:hypothetical protein
MLNAPNVAERLADDQSYWGEGWNSGRPNKQLYIRKKLVISSGRIFARGEGERSLFAPHKQHLHLAIRQVQK